MLYTLTAAFSSDSYALFNTEFPAKVLHNFPTPDNSGFWFFFCLSLSLFKKYFYMRKPLETNISPKSDTFMVQLILQVDKHSF